MGRWQPQLPLALCFSSSVVGWGKGDGQAGEERIGEMRKKKGRKETACGRAPPDPSRLAMHGTYRASCAAPAEYMLEGGVGRDWGEMELAGLSVARGVSGRVSARRSTRHHRSETLASAQRCGSLHTQPRGLHTLS